jgi:hypothetical protein
MIQVIISKEVITDREFVKGRVFVYAGGLGLPPSLALRNNKEKKNDEKIRMG